jgi:ABC-type uncharacterized transport system substrate-binding protein
MVAADSMIGAERKPNLRVQPTRAGAADAERYPGNLRWDPPTRCPGNHPHVQLPPHSAGHHHGATGAEGLSDWLSQLFRCSDDPFLRDPFRHGLRELGYVEGRNLVIECRGAPGKPDRFLALAAELARLNVDVLVAVGTPLTLAARQATRTVPIVTVYVSDPVLGVRPQRVELRASADLDAAFAAVLTQRAEALYVYPLPITPRDAERLAAFALKNRLPTATVHEPYMRAGLLICYAADIARQFRRAGIYIDKILKGAKPGDLPVEQPDKFELLINLKTAKALNLTIPRSLLLRADRVVE